MKLIPSLTAAGCLLLLLLAAPAAAQEPAAQEPSAVVTALDHVAELEFKQALRTLDKAKEDDLAPVLGHLIRAYEGKKGSGLQLAVEKAREVPAEDFDEALAHVRKLLVGGEDLPAGTHLRELWCHLWTLHPAAPDSSDVIEAATFVPEDAEVFPVKRTSVAPYYPLEARKARVTGSVVVATFINQNGCVIGTEVLESSSDALASSAVDSVRWWTFEPVREDGKAIPVEYHLTVNYTLVP